MLSLLVVVTAPQNTNVRNAETVDCIRIFKSDTRSVKPPAYRLYEGMLPVYLVFVVS
ncbi:MAG: hypothetical protein HC862_11535 [Scytonema sp. RU_4_4]|nr:hypothetical protein [Scytonema sp. RU_4_4]